MKRNDPLTMNTSQDCFNPKTPEKSVTRIANVMFPRDANQTGRVKAGVIMKMIDIGASLTSSKHTGKNTVTASLDRMDFINPARIWELVTVESRPVKTWKSSMEIEVVVSTENTRTGQQLFVAKGYLVFVAVDDEVKGVVPIRPIALTEPEDLLKAEESELRKNNRKAEALHVGDLALSQIQPEDNPEKTVRIMTPDESNIYMKVFGGVILELIHDAGEKAAFRYVKGPVIAVRQDRMNFEQPAYIGEEVTASAIVTKSWQTSLEVQVEVFARDYKTGDARRIATSYLVFVAQDEGGNPTKIQAAVSQTKLQKLREQQADIRRGIRLLEREQLKETRRSF
jgi:acyl-CoA hydrolase